MVVAPTLIPSLRSSPWIRTQPYLGFSTQPENEPPDLGTDRGAARPSRSPVRPLAAHQFPVPPQEGLGSDQERGLSIPWQRPAGDG
jgi:hypothetical protein